MHRLPQFESTKCFYTQSLETKLQQFKCSQSLTSFIQQLYFTCMLYVYVRFVSQKVLKKEREAAALAAATTHLSHHTYQAVV